MSAMNAFYAQSGGVTAVINATACGVIETARKHQNRIAKVYAGRNGIIGALTEDLAFAPGGYEQGRGDPQERRLPGAEKARQDERRNPAPHVRSVGCLRLARRLRIAHPRSSSAFVQSLRPTAPSG